MTAIEKIICQAINETCDQLHPRQARAIVAELAAAGYVIVPKEPTEAMKLAGAKAISDGAGEHSVHKEATISYRAMVAHAFR